MNVPLYLPILKSKLGEFTALAHLDIVSKSKIIPLFEVTPLEWDQTERKVPRTWEEHLDSFCKKIITKWPSSNCFIDPSLLKWKENDNTHRIGYVFDRLNQRGILPAPVLWPTASENYLSTFENLIIKYGIKDIGIRVTPNDITADDFESQLSFLFDRMKLTVSNSHLILDLVDSNFNDVENFVDGISEVIVSFPFIDQWKSFTVAGTAFPASTLIKEGISEFSRNDWKFFSKLLQRLRERNFNRQINYGDYSIVNPGYFEFNPKVMKASANIRYTLNEKWVIVKGRALKQSADYTQYKRLAKEIVEREDFHGEEFSKGDKHLVRCVRNQEGPGAPSVWNWVGNNHHFVKVIADLSAMSVAS